MLGSTKNFVKALPGNLAIVRNQNDSILEVIYINHIYQITSSYLLQTESLDVDHEVELETDAISYFLQNNRITKTKQQNILFSINNTEILPLSENTVVGLLTDDNKLIRHVARDWYKKLC